MRISDWSSDVCSSDLSPSPPARRASCYSGASFDSEPSRGRRFRSIREQQHRRLDQFLERLHIARGVPAIDDAVVAADRQVHQLGAAKRSEEHTSELQSLMRISYAVFCLKNKKKENTMY